MENGLWLNMIWFVSSSSSNIREVIAFPFNQQAQDLMMNAPAEVDMKQLRELRIVPLEPELKFEETFRKLKAEAAKIREIEQAAQDAAKA